LRQEQQAYEYNASCGVSTPSVLGGADRRALRENLALVARGAGKRGESGTSESDY